MILKKKSFSPLSFSHLNFALMVFSVINFIVFSCRSHRANRPSRILFVFVFNYLHSAAIPRRRGDLSPVKSSFPSRPRPPPPPHSPPAPNSAVRLPSPDALCSRFSPFFDGLKTSVLKASEALIMLLLVTNDVGQKSLAMQHVLTLGEGVASHVSGGALEM